MKTLLLIGTLLTTCWSLCSCGVTGTLTVDPTGNITVDAAVPAAVLAEK